MGLKGERVSQGVCRPLLLSEAAEAHSAGLASAFLGSAASSACIQHLQADVCMIGKGHACALHRVPYCAAVQIVASNPLQALG